MTDADQAWFNHAAIRKRIAEAEREFLAGRTQLARTSDEAQTLLDSWKKRSQEPQ